MSKLTFHITYDFDSFQNDFPLEDVDIESVWNALIQSHKGHIHIDDVSRSVIEQITDVITESVQSLNLEANTFCDDPLPLAQESTQDKMVEQPHLLHPVHQ